MPYDLIGAEELISGSLDLDDYVGATDLVGAAPRLRGGMAMRGGSGGGNAYQNAMRQAAAFKAAQAGIISRPLNPTKARTLILGLTSVTAVNAGVATTIIARQQAIAFKPRRLVIPATIAPDFTLQDIKVGNKSQLLQSNDVPCEAFAQTAFGVEMDMDTVQTSQDFVLAVTNISGANRIFRAVVYGRAADY